MFINLGFGGGGPGNSFITGNETKNHMALTEVDQLMAIGQGLAGMRPITM